MSELTNMIYANADRTAILADHPKRGRIVVTKNNKAWNNIKKSDISEFQEPDENAAQKRLDALNVTRDELLDAVLSAMNTAQLSGQVNWSQPLDGILSAWAAHGKPENKKQPGEEKA